MYYIPFKLFDDNSTHEHEQYPEKMQLTVEKSLQFDLQKIMYLWSVSYQII